MPFAKQREKEREREKRYGAGEKDWKKKDYQIRRGNAYELFTEEVFLTSTPPAKLKQVRGV